MFLGAAEEAGEVGGVGSAEGIVKADEAAAAFDVGFEGGLLLIGEVAGVALVNHDDVSVLERGGAGEVERAIDDGAAIGEELAPVGEELRVVVLAGGVGLEAGPEEDAHAVRVLALGRGTGCAADWAKTGALKARASAEDRIVAVRMGCMTLNLCGAMLSNFYL